MRQREAWEAKRGLWGQQVMAVGHMVCAHTWGLALGMKMSYTSFALAPSGSIAGFMAWARPKRSG